MPSLNLIVTLLVVGIVVILFLTMAISGFTRQRRRSEAQQEHAHQLGFAPEETSDPLLVDRVEKLFVRGPVTGVRLENVSQRLLSGGQSYLFDLYHLSTAKGGTYQGRMLGVLSPDLQLPYFVLTPIPARTGAAGLKIMHSMERFLSAGMLAMGMTLVEFPELPDFAANFLVFGKTGGEDDLRAFFQSGRGSRLAGLDHDYLIQGQGDFFVLQANPKTVPSRDADPEQELTYLLTDAQRILGWLR